jgi:hypothetical protein
MTRSVFDRYDITSEADIRDRESRDRNKGGTTRPVQTTMPQKQTA